MHISTIGHETFSSLSCTALLETLGQSSIIILRCWPRTAELSGGTLGICYELRGFNIEAFHDACYLQTKSKMH
jgi:uncharacterized protein (DUF488 family)